MLAQARYLAVAFNSFHPLTPIASPLEISVGFAFKMYLKYLALCLSRLPHPNFRHYYLSPRSLLGLPWSEMVHSISSNLCSAQTHFKMRKQIIPAL